MTHAGRTVEYMLAGCQTANPRHRVVITCRHHCCEMMASYAVEGILAWLVDSDDAAARWLRDHVQLFVVPFVDVDGVEAGDQGKNRHPRDHNRDYEGESVHSTPAALRALLPRWSAGCSCVALDLHCPHIAGPHNEVIYLVGSRDPRNAAEQGVFSTLLESVARGPLPFHAADYLPFGQAWNTGGNFAGGRSFSAWAATLPGVQLATSIELPYANARGVEVNQDSAHAFGVDLARALCGYLRR